MTAPAATPVTVPEDEPMETIKGLLLIQVPPPETSVNVLVLPMHTDDESGAIADGVAKTVTNFVAEQPPTV